MNIGGFLVSSQQCPSVPDIHWRGRSRPGPGLKGAEGVGRAPGLPELAWGAGCLLEFPGSWAVSVAAAAWWGRGGSPYGSPGKPPLPDRRCACGKQGIVGFQGGGVGT